MEKRSLKNRVYINLAIGISLLSDFFSLVNLVFNGIHFSYDLFMVAITVIDILLLLAMRFSNPRMRSTAAVYSVYAVLLLIAAFGMTFRYGVTYVNKLMPTVSILVFLFSHILCTLLTVAICFMCRNETKSLNKKRIAVAVALTGIVSAIYVGFIFSTGFFGQGLVSRELIYTLDPWTDTYSVTGVAEGRGGTIVIPDSFDGKQVSCVSAEIFEDVTIQHISFEKRDSELQFLFDPSNSFSLSKNLKSIQCSKENIDAVKAVFYKRSGRDEFAFANLIAPSDLDENEVCVTFSLSREDAEIIGDIPKTWIRPKGTVFPMDFDPSAEFTLHLDARSPEDLEWNYSHNCGWLFTGVGVGKDQLVGKAVNESINGATLQFVRIYRVAFNEDNDTKYEIPKELICDRIGKALKEYKYVLAETADDIYAKCNRREGFELAFLAGGSRQPSLAGYLQEIRSLDTVYITPEWTMKPISVSGVGLAAGSTASSFGQITYGDDLALHCETVGVESGFSVSYQWIDPSGADLSCENDTCTIHNIAPNRAGDYQVRVEKTTADSSLKVWDIYVIRINVRPIELDFQWNIPASDVYSGSEKSITADYPTEKIINGDSVSFSILVNGILGGQIRDAGTYQLQIALANEWLGKYAVRNPEKTYTVQKKPATLVWDVDSYVYDGEAHQPRVINIEGVEGSDTVSSLISRIKYSNEAGTNYAPFDYQVSAEVGELKNYSFATTHQNFRITKRSLYIVSRSTDSLIYNGYDQYPKVTELGNVVPGENDTALNLVNYSIAGGAVPNACRNVGNYSETVSLPENCNYEFRGDVELTTNFQISSIGLRVVAVPITVTYGDAVPTYQYQIIGFKGSDTERDLSGSLQFACDYAAGSSVGSYAITPSGYASENYQIVFESAALTVQKKALTITARNRSITYGAAAPTYQYNASGFVLGESLSDLSGSLQYNCGYIAGSAAGTYDIVPKGVSSGNYTITFTKGTLTVNRAPLTVCAENKMVNYGEDVPTYTVTYSGFVNSEDETVLNGTLIKTCSYQKGSVAGTYDIVLSGLTADNYTITFTKGTLTVKKIPLKITADSFLIQYGGAKPAYNYHFDISSVDVEKIIGTPVFTCAYGVGSSVGTYEITVSGLESAAYAISYESGTVTVEKADITVAVNPVTIRKGDPVPAFTISAVGLTDGEDVEVLGTPNFIHSYTPETSPAGTYPVTVNGLDPKNYRITAITNGILTVEEEST